MVNSNKNVKKKFTCRLILLLLSIFLINIVSSATSDSFYKTNSTTSDGWDYYDGNFYGASTSPYNGTSISNGNMDKMYDNNNNYHNFNNSIGISSIQIVWAISEISSSITNITLKSSAIIDCDADNGSVCGYNKIFIWNNTGSSWFKLYNDTETNHTKRYFNLSITGSSGGLVDYIFGGNISFKYETSAGGSTNISIDEVNLTISYVPDTNPPNTTFTINTLFNNSGQSSDNSTIFYYSANDSSDISSCSIILDGLINITSTSISKISNNNFTVPSIPIGNHSWKINCTDQYSNVGSSVLRQFTILNFTSFSGLTTDFTQINVTNITNLTLEKTSFGRVNFINSIDLSDGYDISSNLQLTEFEINIESSVLTPLNTSAEITFYNVTFTNPRIVKDGNLCPSNICQLISYSNDNYVFNVTQFSRYVVQETQVQTGGNTGNSPSQAVRSIEAVALLKHENETKRTFTDRDRSIIYAVIQSYDDLYSIGDKVDNNQTEELINILKNKDVQISLEEFNLWFIQYIDNQIEMVRVTETDLIKYGLIRVTKIELVELKLTPRTINPFSIITSKKDLSYILKGNRDIDSCKIISKSKIDLGCRVIDNSTVEIFYPSDKLNSFRDTIMGEVMIISIEGSKAYVPIKIEVYNLLYFDTSFILIGLGLVIFITTGIFIYFRKRGKNGG